MKISTTPLLPPRADLTESERLLIPKINPAYHFSAQAKDIQEDIAEGKKVLLTGHMGCISGESIVNLSRAKKSYQITIAEAYRKQELGLQNSKIPTKTRSFLNSENRIGLHNIVTIKQSGIKETFEVALADGKSLRLTADHEILTNDGFLATEKLKVGMEVMTDTLHAECSNTHKPKSRYKYKLGLKFHPFADATTGASYNGGRTFQVPEHRVIAEANLNGIAFDTFIKDIKTGNIENYTFLNPKEYHVHHKDGNHKNNNQDNLEVLTPEEHWKLHGQEYIQNFGQGFPKYSEVISIEHYGEEMTYDIICDDPHRNFVANGIVVHNCGKTSLFEQLAAQISQPVMRVNMNGQTTISDFVGFWTAKGGNTEWVDGILTICMRRGYWAIIDELDFAEASMLSVLNSVTEKNGKLFLKEKGHEIVSPHKHFMLAATANTAGIMEDCRAMYQGTNILNRALLDRFRVHHVDYLPASDEADVLSKTVEGLPAGVARVLVKLATEVRLAFSNELLSSTFSLRQLIDFAELMTRKKRNDKTGKLDPNTIIMQAAETSIYSKVSREDGEVIKALVQRVLCT